MEKESEVKLSYQPFEVPSSEPSQRPTSLRFSELWGSIRRVTSAPTWIPRKVEEEIAIDETNNLFYWYDYSGATWYSTTSTSTSREVFIPAEAMNPTTTSGCAALAKVEAGTNDVDYWVLDFDQTTAESCFFTLRMPDNWNASTVTFRFIWTTAGGGSSETVDWGVKGRAYADDDAIDQAYGTEITTTDTRLANNDIHLSPESTAVTLAGTPAAGQWAQFKITRKVSTDNLASDARLIGIRLKYSIT